MACSEGVKWLTNFININLHLYKLISDTSCVLPANSLINIKNKENAAQIIKVEVSVVFIF